MDINNLRTVVRRAMADGYVAANEAEDISKYALKDDNTVTKSEKEFLMDAYEQGAYFEPYSQYVFAKLISYGDVKISDEMNDLRKRKKVQGWTNSEYVEHAVPVLKESTDSLTNRFNELASLKREANLFTSEYKDYGIQLLLNSSDSIAVRMNTLIDFKHTANLFNSEYKDLGKQLLLNSFDTKAARLLALDDFKQSAGLFNSEYKEIEDAIQHDS